MYQPADKSMINTFGGSGPWDGSIAEDFGGGSGSAGSPYLINDASQLAYMAQIINNNYQQYNPAYHGRYYKLTTSIDLGKQKWRPIGDSPSEEDSFTSFFFDGSSNTIRGLYVLNPDKPYQGLFGRADVESSIKNLTVADAYVSGMHEVGGIIGKIKGNIENCSVSGQILARERIAGIAGTVRFGSIKNCTNDASVTCESQGAGIAGSMPFGSEIVNCVNNGKIIAISGGLIAGIIAKAEDTLIIRNCQNTGELTAERNQLGGITSLGGNFYNCINSGNLHNKNGSNTGGITGVLTGQLKGCVNTGKITGLDVIGGLTGSAGNSGSVEAGLNQGEVNGKNYVGGIAGKVNNSSTLEFCMNKAKIIGTRYVGGVAGEAILLRYCNNDGYVFGSEIVGGICGSAKDIELCTNTGAVSGILAKIGGVAGTCSSATHSLNTALISGHGPIGGIIGECIGNTVDNCYNIGSLNASGIVGGIVGSTNQNDYQLLNCFNGGWIPDSWSPGAILGTHNGRYQGDAKIQNTYFYQKRAARDIGTNAQYVSTKTSSLTLQNSQTVFNSISETDKMIINTSESTQQPMSVTMQKNTNQYSASGIAKEITEAALAATKRVCISIQRSGDIFNPNSCPIDERAIPIMERYYNDSSNVSSIVDSQNGICIFALEGLGNHYGTGESYFFPKGRYGAMMVVTRGNTIEYVTYTASTIPSGLIDPDDEKQELAIANEGVYDVGGKRHQGNYAALQLYAIGTNSSEISCRRKSKPKGTADGINIHTAPNNTGRRYSFGCQLIGTQDYIQFLIITGCISPNDIWAQRLIMLDVEDQDEFEGFNNKGFGITIKNERGKYEEAILGYKPIANRMNYNYPQYEQIPEMRYVIDRTHMPENQKIAFCLKN